MRTLITLIAATIVTMSANAQIRDDGKLTIPAGISLIGTNKNYVTPVITFTNMTSSNIVIYAYDRSSLLDSFRLVQVPVGGPDAPLPDPKYQAIVSPMCPPIRLGPHGSTNSIGRLPGTIIRNGLIVKTSGQVDTDFTPTFTIGTLPTLP